MKRGNEPPRLLPHVLQAITDLRETGGCTTRRIVDMVRTNVSSPVRPRNITVQVRRAIKHGIDRGIIKQRQGKYYANFNDPLKHAVVCRRRGRKKRGGRRRKRQYAAKRTYGEVTDVTSGDSLTATDSDWDRSRSGSRTPEPADRGRRRRKGRKGRRRRRDSFVRNMEPQGENKKTVPGKKDYSEEYGQLEDSERPECNNPECLCNLKQEKPKQEPTDGPVRKSRENFRHDYIN